jgi:hypothetical protein
MNTSRLVLVAALAAAAFSAQADEADASQFVAQAPTSQTTRAQAQAQLQQRGANTFSIQYNPLNSFRSGKTRAQVTGEYFANRDAVAAFTAEDSGSAFLAANKALPAANQFAGQPVNAQ